MQKMINIIEDNKVNQKELFYANDKNPFDCAIDLLEILKKAIDLKAPFSMIRLGDGEGRILGFPEVFERKVYLNEVLTYQYGGEVIKRLKELHGDEFLENSISELKGFITNAIESADLIGAPSWLHFRSEITESNLTPLTAQSVCLEYTKKMARGKKVFDHFIFKPFNGKGFFYELLKNVSKLNVISHTDITVKIAHEFDLTTCTHIQIPGHQSFMKTGELHYPDEYKNVLKSIENIEPGELFFVAAGYLGKHYCHHIKMHGGLAIDIGSIFDGWCGKGREDAIKNLDQRL